ncbi:Cell wall-associated hydrolase, invasion-associated protein [Paraburkholderia ribeironis]|uniref:Cell wall-associated hydrolase, invasion-associated protein n=1 Tax=Paraburkholderia ribeironis TaxID=1247936 RepID=A0A1N7S0A0_9BURK|nr:SH3 domain-containing C40 family peptidase [Paraburkholderia ribeironis]SIT40829.1 Cell wall-associated hydrolase, invasion-associated protein [Paraburkholderia ribeironis]
MSVAVLSRLASWPTACRTAALCAALAALTACSTPSPTHDAYAHAPVDTITLFPIAGYDQNVDHWLAPDSPGYDQPFLSPADQQAHFRALYARYFGTGTHAPSPWNAAYVTTRVYREQGADIAALQERRIDRFDNTGKSGAALGYGQDFRPHDKAWIDAIAENMNVGQFTQAPVYQPQRRAIATANLMVRELPTMDPSFYNHRLAGEGYPFDNLQISAARPGTPLYVLGSSIDGAWHYVQTPDVQGWVRSDGVARADERFVDTWRAATGKSLGAVTVASAPVRDSGGVFRFDAPAGTLLPLLPTAPSLPAGSADAARQAAAHGAASEPSSAAVVAVAGTADSAGSAATRAILVPARDADGRALIRRATLSDAQIAPMPLAATPRHLAMLMKTLIGRPYGWGNTGLYNDCSSELQSIFAAFGVWLPRHSSTQMSAGRMIDLSASTPAQRLDYLAQHGEALRTLIYIGGHVMLYIGNTTRDGVTVPVVYQDVWGLRPADNSRRAVIGGSVILPLFEHIPEDATLQSLAGTPTFQISILGAPGGNAAPPSVTPPDEDNPAG